MLVHEKEWKDHVEVMRLKNEEWEFESEDGKEHEMEHEEMVVGGIRKDLIGEFGAWFVYKKKKIISHIKTGLSIVGKNDFGVPLSLIFQGILFPI